jgi:predicted dehydrogenase
VLRGALIGVGNAALHGHLPGWRRRPDVTLVAASDTEPERREPCEAALPGVRWYASAAELLEDPRLDFVDICTPPSSHAGLIRSALRRGLHVLCEKPLVGSLEELRSVAELARTTGRVVHTVHNWRHAPMVRRASELVREGAIGSVQQITWHTLRTRPAAPANNHGTNWRVDPAIAGGGVLTDHGWHAFYLLMGWIGQPPLLVAARLEKRRHVSLAVEDTATVTLAFAGARADVFLTWASDERRSWAELVGTAGAIRLDGDAVVLEGRRNLRWVCPPPLSDGSQHPDWFDGVIGEFVVAAGGTPRSRSNLDEATRCVAVESAARESDRRGGAPLPLPAPPAGPRDPA